MQIVLRGGEQYYLSKSGEQREVLRRGVLEWEGCEPDKAVAVGWGYESEQEKGEW